MVEIDIIQAHPGHIKQIASIMRQADRDEVWASHLASPAEALEISLGFSPMAWTGRLDQQPFCMFGVAVASPQCRHGAPWMLGGPQIERHSLGVLRRSRVCIAEMTKHYPVLSNLADARNRTSLRWLNWLGFTIRPAIPHGPFNLLFHPFELRSSPHVCS